jgi:catechol 2,3-dioxygenase-like lactoylglutathione lyase family enzyme
VRWLKAAMPNDRVEIVSEGTGRPFRVNELDHVVLRCTNQQRALAFYTGILGLVEERRIEQIGLIQLRAGQSMPTWSPAATVAGDGRNVDHFAWVSRWNISRKLLAYLREKGGDGGQERPAVPAA